MGCVDKKLIDTIVENIDEVLKYPEVRNAIVDHDIKEKQKTKKIDIKTDNIKEFSLRFNDGITFILFYEDFIVNYLFTLKTYGINPKVITHGEIIQYGCLLLTSLKDNGVYAVMNLEELKTNEFYKKYSAFFKRIENDDVEIVGDISTADIGKLFQVYLPFQIMPSIIDNDVRNKTKNIYDKTCKRYKYKKED
ncbi:MAG: hypothetical protein IKZ96_00730 [Bacilli bacterium]|nr:hypothetical protein [Bacilli bacterium]